MVKRAHSEGAEGVERMLATVAEGLGREARLGRQALSLTQEQFAARVGIARSTQSDLERGRGGGHTLDTWLRVGAALQRPLRLAFERDRVGETRDAGHLAIQELVLRVSAPWWEGAFEAPVPAVAGRHSTDVVLRRRGGGMTVLVECWNTIDDLGAAARTSAAKLRRTEEVAIARGRLAQSPLLPVASCWVVRASSRNAATLRRYPEVLAARFPGSSLGWVRALAVGAEAPSTAGLVWCDVAASRLYPWRRG